MSQKIHVLPHTSHDSLMNAAGLERRASGPSVTADNKESKVVVSREKLSSASARVLGSFKQRLGAKLLLWLARVLHGQGTGTRTRYICMTRMVRSCAQLIRSLRCGTLL